MPNLPKNTNIISCVEVSKATLPKIRVSRLMPEGHGHCVTCGIKATHVITYTLASEDHRVVYSNIFAFDRMLTADHILPYSLGGSGSLENLQLMCSPCNGKKSNVPTAEEIERIRKNIYAHLRFTFNANRIERAIKMYPQLECLYDGITKSDNVVYFRQKVMAAKGKKKKVFRMSDGLVNSEHPHHPMWGWVRILKQFPELKNHVTFC